jgi:chaperonin GroES
MRIEPVTNRILVEPYEVPDKVGALHIPDSAVSRPQRGKIVSVGPDCKQARSGDEVIWSKHLGADIEVEGKKYIIMKEPDAHLILKPNSNNVIL